MIKWATMKKMSVTFYQCNSTLRQHDKNNLLQALYLLFFYNIKIYT
jgi:hypothetical protein